MIMSLQEKRRNAMIEYALIIAAFFAILLAIVAISNALRSHSTARNAAHQATSCALVCGMPRSV